MDAQANPSLMDRPTGVIAESTPKPRRTWLAVVALFLLAPLVAELLSGSTPPLAWNNVGGALLTISLYGSGVLLAREIVRRRGLGWGNLALLGAAYGALEEGISYQSWFNPGWTPPPDAARYFGVNWTFATAFTSIHTALSVLTSVVLAEALFPGLAERPWLGRKGAAAFSLLLGLVVAALIFSYGFTIYRGKGYDHPPLSYALAPALFLLLLTLGTFAPIPVAQPAGNRRAPRLWLLRIAGFLGAFVVLFNLFILRNVAPAPLIPIALILATDLLSIYLVRRWARRPGWGMQRRLALAAGVMGVFIVFSPVFEFLLPNQRMTGLTLANLLALGALIFLTYRVARYEVALGDSAP
jgi:hypothetical protein